MAASSDGDGGESKMKGWTRAAIVERLLLRTGGAETVVQSGMMVAVAGNPANEIAADGDCDDCGGGDDDGDDHGCSHGYRDQNRPLLVLDGLAVAGDDAEGVGKEKVEWAVDEDADHGLGKVMGAERKKLEYEWGSANRGQGSLWR